MNTWSFFKDGLCTGVMFHGDQATMLLNLPAGHVAVEGPFAPDDPIPAGVATLSKENPQ